MSQDLKIKHERTAREIRQVCNAVADRLIQKNEAYGDAALNPEQIFASCNPIELINVRMDDKLSRIKAAKAKGSDSMGEDPERDLLGYLVLKEVARMRLAQGKEAGAVVAEKAPEESVAEVRRPSVEEMLDRRSGRDRSKGRTLVSGDYPA